MSSAKWRYKKYNEVPLINTLSNISQTCNGQTHITKDSSKIWFHMYHNDTTSCVMASQIIANSNVCSTACPGNQQGNHQNSKLPVGGGFRSQRASNFKSISITYSDFIVIWQIVKIAHEMFVFWTNTLPYWQKKSNLVLFAAFGEKRPPGLDKN